MLIEAAVRARTAGSGAAGGVPGGASLEAPAAPGPARSSASPMNRWRFMAAAKRNASAPPVARRTARACASAAVQLHFLPERIPFGGRQPLERESALRREPLHAAKATLELRIGAAQHSLGIEPEMAAEIHDRKQEVAQLARGLTPGACCRCAARERRVELAELLVDFGTCPRGIRPVEADPRGTAPELRRTHQCGKRSGHAGERAAITGLSGGLLALARLLRLPVPTQMLLLDGGAGEHV